MSTLSRANLRNIANKALEKDDKKQRVSLMRDTALSFPDLWLDVYIAGDKYEEAAFSEMFIRAKCSKAWTPESADIVVFTGGDDVNPALYGESNKHWKTHVDKGRDDSDIELFHLCYEKGIPMVGICRGFQFLHVMHGGRLYQDIDNHQRQHDIWDFDQKRMISGVSSVHHQAIVFDRNIDMKVIADTHQSKERWLNAFEKEVSRTPGDIEAAFYHQTSSLGIQGHPEYSGYYAFTKWSLMKIMDYVIDNPDTELRTDGGTRKYRRLKEEFMATRKPLEFGISKQVKEIN